MNYIVPDNRPAEMPADKYTNDPLETETLSYFQNTNSMLSNPIIPNQQPLPVKNGLMTGGQALSKE